MDRPFYYRELYNKSYFEAGRRPRNRSILIVCEDFEGKPDAKRALLGNFHYSSVCSSSSSGRTNSVKPAATKMLNHATAFLISET